MARDVLLLLLVLGVVLHLALLCVVAVVHARRAARTAWEVGPQAEPARYRPLTGMLPVAPPAPRMRRQLPPAEPTIRAIPVVGQEPDPSLAGSMPAGRPVPPRNPPTDPVRVVAPPVMASGEDLPTAEPAAGPGAAQPAISATKPAGVPALTEPPATRPAAGGRPRRFTIPDLDEDHDRTGRAIAAFLGEPVPAGGARPHRRQHRARRPAGAPAPRVDLVLAIGEPTPPSRVARAVAAALRDIARESDEIVELPGGRLRVSLEADQAGSEAFVERARVSVRPWLALLDARLELRVEQSEASLPGRSPAAG